MARRFAAAAIAALIVLTVTYAQQPAPTTDPALQPVLDKMAKYVASYGEKASMYVGVEKYTQSVTLAAMNPDAPPLRPRQVVAEFAIVKVPGDAGWIGFRDVVEYDGKKVSDRRDRLVTILTDPAADSTVATQLANESARYNVGPISRNFNTPTATLFFFHPSNLERFAFAKKETKKIDGIETWEITFKETKRPALVRTRAGLDVPLEGSLWVVPADGTIVRSRLTLRNFADQMAPTSSNIDMGGKGAVNPNTPTGGRAAIGAASSGGGIDFQRIDSLADIDVTYAKHPQFGVWLPSKMTENYAGGLTLQKGKPAQQGTAITRANYSDFKQFDTGVKINIPK